MKAARGLLALAMMCMACTLVEEERERRRATEFRSAIKPGMTLDQIIHLAEVEFRGTDWTLVADECSGGSMELFRVNRQLTGEYLITSLGRDGDARISEGDTSAYRGLSEALESATASRMRECRLIEVVNRLPWGIPIQLEHGMVSATNELHYID